MRHHYHERGLIETSMQAQNHSQHRRGPQVTPVFLSLHHPTTSRQEAQANPAPHIHLHPPMPSRRQSHTPTIPTVRRALTQPIPSPPLLHPTPPPSHLQLIPSHRASHPTPPTLQPHHQLLTPRPPLFWIDHGVRLRL